MSVQVPKLFIIQVSLLLLVYNFDKMTTAARKETISELSTLYQTYFDFSEEKEVQGYYEDFAALRNDKQTADFTIELQDQQRFIAHVPILVIHYPDIIDYSSNTYRLPEAAISSQWLALISENPIRML